MALYTLKRTLNIDIKLGVLVDKNCSPPLLVGVFLPFPLTTVHLKVLTGISFISHTKMFQICINI